MLEAGQTTARQRHATSPRRSDAWQADIPWLGVLTAPTIALVGLLALSCAHGAAASGSSCEGWAAQFCHGNPSKNFQPGIGYPHAKTTSGPTTTSAAECCCACAAEPTCNGWTLNSGKKTCFLKQDAGPATAVKSETAMSGLMPARPPPPPYHPLYPAPAGAKNILFLAVDVTPSPTVAQRCLVCWRFALPRATLIVEWAGFAGHAPVSRRVQFHAPRAAEPQSTHRQTGERGRALHTCLRPVRILFAVTEQLHEWTPVGPPPHGIVARVKSDQLMQAGHDESVGVCRSLPRGRRGAELGFDAAVLQTVRIPHARRRKAVSSVECNREHRESCADRVPFSLLPAQVTEPVSLCLCPTCPALFSVLPPNGRDRQPWQGMPFMDWPESWSPERPYFFPQDNPGVTTCSSQGPFALPPGSPPVRDPQQGLYPDKMALITSDCDAMRSPSIKWP